MMDGGERKEFIVFWLVLVKGRGGGDGTRFSPEAEQKKWSLGLAFTFRALSTRSVSQWQWRRWRLGYEGFASSGWSPL